MKLGPQIPSRRGLLLTGLLLLRSPEKAEATLSIVGVDRNTGQMGAAGTSCVRLQNFSLHDETYLSSPGKSALMAQGFVAAKDDPHILLALELMENNTPPEDVLTAITDPSVDDGTFPISDDTDENLALYTIRQYGLVNLEGDAAGYTGGGFDRLYALLDFVPSWNEDMQGEGEPGGFSYSAQGNVVSESTVSLLGSTFESAGCDLAGRLYSALDAVEKAGEGDVRCTDDNGFAGLTAFVKIEDSGGNDVLLIDIPSEIEPDVDPFVALRERYDAWRGANPCPAELPPPTAAATSPPTSAPAAPATSLPTASSPTGGGMVRSGILSLAAVAASAFFYA